MKQMNQLFRYEDAWKGISLKFFISNNKILAS